jgi:hypothetical protein
MVFVNSEKHRLTAIMIPCIRQHQAIWTALNRHRLYHFTVFSSCYGEKIAL